MLYFYKIDFFYKLISVVAGFPLGQNVYKKHKLKGIQFEIQKKISGGISRNNYSNRLFGLFNARQSDNQRTRHLRLYTNGSGTAQQAFGGSGRCSDRNMTESRSLRYRKVFTQLPALQTMKVPRALPTTASSLRTNARSTFGRSRAHF